MVDQSGDFQGSFLICSWAGFWQGWFLSSAFSSAEEGGADGTLGPPASPSEARDAPGRKQEARGSLRPGRFPLSILEFLGFLAFSLVFPGLPGPPSYY